MTTVESRWTEQDTAEILALAEYRDSLCPCCGLPKADVHANEADAPRFVVSKVACLARLNLIENQMAAEDPKKPNPRHAARVWSVRIDRG